jgi:hypothetical protein
MENLQAGKSNQSCNGASRSKRGIRLKSRHSITAYTDAREVYSLIEEYARGMKNQNRLLKKLWP